MKAVNTDTSFLVIGSIWLETEPQVYLCTGIRSSQLAIWLVKTKKQ